MNTMHVNSETKTYTVSDGDLVLELTEVDGGWYAVTTPLDPHVHTQARSLDEAFDMARDAMASLHEARAKYIEQIEATAAQSA